MRQQAHERRAGHARDHRVVFASRSTENSVNGASAPAPPAAASADTPPARRRARASSPSSRARRGHQRRRVRRAQTRKHPPVVERGARRPRKHRRGGGGRDELGGFLPRLRGVACRFGRRGEARKRAAEHAGSVVRVVRRGRARGRNGTRRTDAHSDRGGARVCHPTNLALVSRPSVASSARSTPIHQKTRRDRPQKQTASCRWRSSRVHARARQRRAASTAASTVALDARVLCGGQRFVRARQRAVRPQTPGVANAVKDARGARRLAPVHRQELLGVDGAAPERADGIAGSSTTQATIRRCASAAACRGRTRPGHDVRLIHVAPLFVLEAPRVARRGRVLAAGRARVVRRRVRGGRDARPPRHERRLCAPGSPSPCAPWSSCRGRR